MQVVLMLTSFDHVVASFKSIAPAAVPVPGLEKYMFQGETLFVDQKTGLLTSSRKMSAADIVGYWSKKIFSSSDPEDYSALNPFAQGRLLYALLTFRKFLLETGNVPERPHLCDFATGQGVLLDLARQHAPDWTLSGTEDSEALASNLASRGHNVVRTGLGFGESNVVSKIGARPNLGAIAWTLCNCIDPIAVLSQVHETLADNSYLCVAESSRILVPFRKSLGDLLSRVHPSDTHPFYFSQRSLAALLKVVGFEPVFSNRYFDSDVLIIIARKRDAADRERTIEMDDPEAVIEFMARWFELSEYFESSLRPGL
jgi:hypothetical protein